MFLTGFDEHRHSLAMPTADVSYIDVGDGPPALFVHGLTTSAYLWHELIGHLGARRRCIAVDLPLHGRSHARPGQKLSIGAFAYVLAGAVLDVARVEPAVAVGRRAQRGEVRGGASGGGVHELRQRHE